MNELIPSWNHENEYVTSIWLQNEYLTSKNINNHYATSWMLWNKYLTTQPAENEIMAEFCLDGSAQERPKNKQQFENELKSDH